MLAREGVVMVGVDVGEPPRALLVRKTRLDEIAGDRAALLAEFVVADVSQVNGVRRDVGPTFVDFGVQAEYALQIAAGVVEVSEHLTARVAERVDVIQSGVWVGVAQIGVTRLEQALERVVLVQHPIAIRHVVRVLGRLAQPIEGRLALDDVALSIVAKAARACLAQLRCHATGAIAVGVAGGGRATVLVHARRSVGIAHATHTIEVVFVRDALTERSQARCLLFAQVAHQIEALLAEAAIRVGQADQVPDAVVRRRGDVALGVFDARELAERVVSVLRHDRRAVMTVDALAHFEHAVHDVASLYGLVAAGIRSRGAEALNTVLVRSEVVAGRGFDEALPHVIEVGRRCVFDDAAQNVVSERGAALGRLRTDCGHVDQRRRGGLTEDRLTLRLHATALVERDVSADREAHLGAIAEVLFEIFLGLDHAIQTIDEGDGLDEVVQVGRRVGCVTRHVLVAGRRPVRPAGIARLQPIAGFQSGRDARALCGIGDEIIRPPNRDQPPKRIVVVMRAVAVDVGDGIDGTERVVRAAARDIAERVGRGRLIDTRRIVVVSQLVAVGVRKGPNVAEAVMRDHGRRCGIVVRAGAARNAPARDAILVRGQRAGFGFVGRAPIAQDSARRRSNRATAATPRAVAEGRAVRREAIRTVVR